MTDMIEWVWLDSLYLSDVFDVVYVSINVPPMSHLS